MSGLEVVGVVLGALPLLIEATKATKFYLEGIGRWWQFETDFDAFVRAITFEDVIFSQNMDLLLTPLDLSLRERNSLKGSPTSALWHHPDIVDQMKQHLNEALPMFTRLLKELNDSLDELHMMIPAPTSEGAVPSSHTMQDEILKLCISFCRKRQTVLDRVSSTNQQLERILRNANDIHSVSRLPSFNRGQQLSKPVEVDSFIKLQKRSRILYSALKAGISCSCQEPHRCGLSAQWDKSKGPALNLFIDDHVGRKQVRWEVEAADRPGPLSRHHQNTQSQVHDMVREDQTTEVITNGDAGVNCASTVPNAANAQTSKTKKPWKARLRGLKSTKRASIAPSSSSIKECQSAQVQAVDEQAPQHPLDAALQGTILEKPPKAASSSSIEICSLIKAPVSDAGLLGLIQADYHDVKFFLDPKQQRRLLQAHDETIERFWSSTSDLAARLQIGLSTAAMLLSLGTSAWVPRGWNKDDIFLMRYNKGANNQSRIFGPYMNHSSLSFTLKETPMSAQVHAEAALFSLGVLMLELHYRQRLEQSSHWHRHCPGGQPNEFTNIAVAYDWYKELASDPALDEGLAEPVRRCIEVSFSTPADLDNGEFLRDVLEAVVQPLEEFIEQWSGKLSY